MGIVDSFRSAADSFRATARAFIFGDTTPVVSPPPARGSVDMSFLGAASLQNTSLGSRPDPRTIYEWKERTSYSPDKLDALGRNGLARRCITLRAFDATREGWSVKFSSNELTAAEKLQANARLTSMQKGLNARAKFRLALTRKEQYGHSIIVMGADDGLADWSQPLDPAKVKRVHWLKVFDARHYTIGPLSDHTSSNCGNPEYYEITDFDRPEVQAFAFNTGTRSIGTKRIHWTRVLGPFHTEDGHSRLDEIAEALEDFFGAHDTSSSIMRTLAIGIYKIRDWLTQTAADEKASRGRILAQHLALTVLNALVIDKEGEDFDWKTRNMTGVPDVIDRKGVLLVAFTGYPAMILLGLDPQGFSTGEEIIDHYHDTVRAEQGDQLEPHLRRFYSVLMRCEDGPKKIIIEPDAWDVYFHPLRRLTLEELAKLRADVWDAAANLADKDLLDRDEVRDSLFSDPSELLPNIQLTTAEQTEDRGQTLEVGVVQGIISLLTAGFGEGNIPRDALRAALEGSVPAMAPFVMRLFPDEPANDAGEEASAADQLAPGDRWLTADQIAERFGSITKDQLKNKRASVPRTIEEGRLTWTKPGAWPLYKESEVRAMFDVMGPDLTAGTSDDPSKAPLPDTPTTPE